MIDLNMTDAETQKYLEFETKILDKVDLGIITMAEAAKLIDVYLKDLED